MRLSRTSRVVLGVVTGLILVVVYVPLLVVLVNSFSTSTSLSWPPPGFTLEWWGKAFHSAGALEAVGTSVVVARHVARDLLAFLAVERVERVQREELVELGSGQLSVHDDVIPDSTSVSRSRVSSSSCSSTSRSACVSSRLPLSCLRKTSKNSDDDACTWRMDLCWPG